MSVFYSDKNSKQSQIYGNYLSEFIIRAEQHFKNENYFSKYASRSLSCMVRFGDWLKKRKIPIKSVDFSHVTHFLLTFPASTHEEKIAAHKRASKMIVSFICDKYSRCPTVSPIQTEIDRYLDYLRSVCGYQESTIEIHEGNLREYFQYICPKANKFSPSALSKSSTKKYIEQLPVSKANSKRKAACSSLSGYFRFLETSGIKAQHLLALIPPVPCSRRSIVPVTITKSELNKLLKSVDRSTAIGKRTYATILCLSDLAMRVGDVSRISLDDIDWRTGTIRITNRKKSTPFLLPLPKRVGKAFVDYITHGRYQSKSRWLFLDHSRHFSDRPATVHALKSAVRRQWEISGLLGQYSGTHILRRSTATALKQQGYSLKVIADLLGHSSIESAALYAQVDVNNLRKACQSWPLDGGVQ